MPVALVAIKEVFSQWLNKRGRLQSEEVVGANHVHKINSNKVVRQDHLFVSLRNALAKCGLSVEGVIITAIHPPQPSITDLVEALATERAERQQLESAMVARSDAVVVPLESVTQVQTVEETQESPTINVTDMLNCFMIGGKSVRKTQDVPPMVSVYDLIEAVTGQPSNEARKTYTRLKNEHPEVAAQCRYLKFSGPGQRLTPVTDARGAVTIINLLQGRNAATFRAASADVFVRFMGGDPTLIDEIRRNAEAQALLPASNPARLFGEDVEAQAQAQAQAQVQQVQTRTTLRRGQPPIPAIDLIRGLNLRQCDEELAVELIEQQKVLVTSPFMERHVMYCCLTNLKHPDHGDRLVIKFGYTADFVDRLRTLLAEYKCELMMMCGIVAVRSEQFEKNFHRMLAARFPNSVCNLKIGNVEKDELYLCDRSILNEFFALVVTTPSQQVELLLAKEKTEQLKLQLEMLRMQKQQNHPT